MTGTLHLALATAAAALGLLCAGCGGGEASPPLVAEGAATDEAQLGEVEMGMNEVAPVELATDNVAADGNEVDAQGPEALPEEEGEGGGSNLARAVDVRTLQIGVRQEPFQPVRVPPPVRFEPMPNIYVPPPYRPPTQPHPNVRPYGRGR